MKRNIIGLMTDWGRDDGAYGSCQGVIWGINPDVQIADMGQNVESFDIKQAAFLLAAHYQTYPKGTIFVVVVDPGVGTKRKAIMVETCSGYFFIGPDNGVLSWALTREKIKKVINVTNGKYFRQSVSATFEGRDVFCPVAAHMSKGVEPTKFGETIQASDMVWAEYPLKKEGDQLVGEVLFIDKFGNLITSINQNEMVDLVGWASFFPPKAMYRLNPFEIEMNGNVINKLSHTFADGKEGEILALFGGDFGDCLDIIVCESSAAETLKAVVGQKVIVRKV